MSNERRARQVIYRWQEEILPGVKAAVEQPIEEETVARIRTVVEAGYSLPLSVAFVVGKRAEFVEKGLKVELPNSMGFDFTDAFSWSFTPISYVDEILHGQDNIGVGAKSLTSLGKAIGVPVHAVGEIVAGFKEYSDELVSVFEQDPTCFALVDYVLASPSELQKRHLAAGSYFPIFDKLAHLGATAYKNHYSAAVEAGIPWSVAKGN